MPKAMQYTKGSIIYFEGDHDERIFIMQQGAVLLTSTDIESGQPVAEQVKSGEFFGVKSALVLDLEHTVCQLICDISTEAVHRQAESVPPVVRVAVL